MANMCHISFRRDVIMYIVHSAKYSINGCSCWYWSDIWSAKPSGTISHYQTLQQFPSWKSQMFFVWWDFCLFVSNWLPEPSPPSPCGFRSGNMKIEIHTIAIWLICQIQKSNNANGFSSNGFSIIIVISWKHHISYSETDGTMNSVELFG